MINTPEQIEGGRSDNYSTTYCSNIAEAKKLYEAAKNRLLAVNKWGQICDTLLTADFTLCDGSGNPVNRPIKEGDHFRINIGPVGTEAGDGYDWVQVERIQIQEDDAKDSEWTSVRVRPATNPLNKESTTAHFFSDKATSTFTVRRTACDVIAEIHGRNERPNTTTNAITDTLRNQVVAGLAVSFFSDAQWKALANALVDKR